MLKTATDIPRRVAFVLGFLLFAFSVLFGWQSWLTVKEQKRLELETVLELTRKASDRYFTEMGASLAGLGVNVNSVGGLTNLPQVQRLLKGFHERRPELTTVSAMRFDGQFLAISTTPALTGLPSIAEERSPEELAIDPASNPLTLWRPVLGTASKRWIVPMRYTLRTTAGEPSAFLIAAVPVELLQNFWSEAPIMSKIVITLMRDDGYLLSRFPPTANATPAQAYATPRTGAARQHLVANNFPKRGYVEGNDSTGQVPFASVFARLEHFPLTLFVSIPVEEFRSAWWDRVRVPYLLIALLALALWQLYRYALNHQREWAEQQNEHALELESRVAQRSEQLRVLGARLEAAESRERRQIARDLHDDLSQTLAAARIRLTPLEADTRDDVRAAAQALAGLINQADHSTRNLAGRLAPAALYEIGLVPALQALAEEIEHDFGIEVAVDDDSKPKPLSQSARSILYRAVRELLINVAKHAVTPEALVECRREGDEIVLQVSDAGTGYDPNAPQMNPGAHLGLPGTRERISFIGGTFEIATAPGKGTQARIRAPLSILDQSERERTA